MSRWRGVWWALAVVAVLVAAWTVFRMLGYFVTVQKSGGWTEQTAVVDFSTEPGARELLERWPEESPVDNLILIMGDGLGFSHVTAARTQLVGVNRLLTFERFPVTGWLDSHSRAELYTDSAAGATALATGVKVDPGALSVGSGGEVLRTLFEAARDAGKSTGWVTDSYFFDASPGGFAIHQGSRRAYAEIIEQMVASGSEVIIGEVRPDFPADADGLAGIHQSFRDGGYRLATTNSELWGMGWSEADKIAGVFPADAIASNEIEPKLTEIFDLALNRLSLDLEGFVLLAEVEDVDSGSHNGDFVQVLRGVSKLEEMTRAAVSFARGNGRTLVLVLSDHETGGLAIITGDEERPLGIRWATTNHTAAPVPFYAYGPSAEALVTARDNTDLAPIVAGLLNVALEAGPIEASAGDSAGDSASGDEGEPVERAPSSDSGEAQGS